MPLVKLSMPEARSLLNPKQLVSLLKDPSLGSKLPTYLTNFLENPDKPHHQAKLIKLLGHSHSSKNSYCPLNISLTDVSSQSEKISQQGPQMIKELIAAMRDSDAILFTYDHERLQQEEPTCLFMHSGKFIFYDHDHKSLWYGANDDQFLANLCKELNITPEMMKGLTLVKVAHKIKPETEIEMTKGSSLKASTSSSSSVATPSSPDTHQSSNEPKIKANTEKEIPERSESNDYSESSSSSSSSSSIATPPSPDTPQSSNEPKIKANTEKEIPERSESNDYSESSSSSSSSSIATPPSPDTPQSSSVVTKVCSKLLSFFAKGSQQPEPEPILRVDHDKAKIQAQNLQKEAFNCGDNL